MKKLHLVVVFAAGLLASRGLAQGKLELDSTQRIKDWGYAIRPIKGWTSIPANAGDKFIVGRWKANMDNLWLRGDWEGWSGAQHCELLIVRLPLLAAPTAEDPAKAKDKPPDLTEGLPPELQGEVNALKKKGNPKSLDELIEARYEGASKRWTRKVFKVGKLTGDIIEFGADAKMILIASFRRDNVDWGVVYTAFEETYRKTWQDIYVKSMQSFALFDAANADLGVRRDTSKLKGEEKRESLKGSIAGNPGWYSIDTANYVFLSNSNNRPFIEILAKEIEMVREKVYAKHFPPRNKESSLSPVRVLDNESEYYQYGGPMGSAGYFNSASGELVLFVKFDDESKSASMAKCRSVMYHEAFHQYVHYAIGDVSPHSWFNEGHGDYFAGLVLGGGSYRVQPFDWRVKFLREHLQGNRDLLPLRTLIRLPQSEYYTNASLKYSQGWAFIYYLRSVTKNKKHQAILDTYFAHVADNIEAFRQKKKEGKEDDAPGGGEVVPGIPGLKMFNFADREKVEKILSEAVDKAFAGIDLEALDKEFRAFVEKL